MEEFFLQLFTVYLQSMGVDAACGVELSGQVRQFSSESQVPPKKYMSIIMNYEGGDVQLTGQGTQISLSGFENVILW